MASFNIKERIEHNITLWILGTLLTGFLSGIGVYRTIQEIAGLTVVPAAALEDSKRRIVELEREFSESQARAAEAAAQRKQAYHAIQATRVRVVYVEPDFEEAADKIKKRLFDLGAHASLKLASGYPSGGGPGKLYYREDALEAAIQIKAPW